MYQSDLIYPNILNMQIISCFLVIVTLLCFLLPTCKTLAPLFLLDYSKYVYIYIYIYIYSIHSNEFFRLSAFTYLLYVFIIQRFIKQNKYLQSFNYLAVHLLNHSTTSSQSFKYLDLIIDMIKEMRYKRSQNLVVDSVPDSYKYQE